jgi:hypothetical protein
MSKFIETDDEITPSPQILNNSQASGSRSRHTTSSTLQEEDVTTKSASYTYDSPTTTSLEEPFLTDYSKVGRFKKRTAPLWKRIRWLLGPAHPLPTSLLPQPSPSMSLSLSTPRKSYKSAIDTKVVRFSKSWKLRYFLWPFIGVWMAGYILLIRQQWWPLNGPPIIGCTSSIWNDWPPDTCGINGTACAQYLAGGEYRCLGGCGDVNLGNPRWVGNEEVNGVPLVVGGKDSATYRYVMTSRHS